ncbi:hypothetical protein ARZXY2_4882 (plasmid) [Arthrobacter sp. ZXY-2]|nr:hypothetical protein ARZXY2_4882 [Arthrobacter sp. ZXY-2]
MVSTKGSTAHHRSLNEERLALGEPFPSIQVQIEFLAGPKSELFRSFL